jgi:hypothetical protein
LTIDSLGALEKEPVMNLSFNGLPASHRQPIPAPTPDSLAASRLCWLVQATLPKYLTLAFHPVAYSHRGTSQHAPEAMLNYILTMRLRRTAAGGRHAKRLKR